MNEDRKHYRKIFEEIIVDIQESNSPQKTTAFLASAIAAVKTVLREISDEKNRGILSAELAAILMKPITIEEE